ncbi:Carboxylesterase family-domain-containing protein [Mycena rosella]|uniref:Carboxylesterase family-domain-containing protein n=1 Tax=Mycena rosella TaxID=1033263 RepID=A0AAD7GDC7_MYCRO|nr:Carboxylesterase family-domain-containing protein [Mycena rosella]
MYFHGGGFETGSAGDAVEGGDGPLIDIAPICTLSPTLRIPTHYSVHQPRTPFCDNAPPENLILGSAKPLIFVTFQYRLGQFGFLGGTHVHDDGVLNSGLLDQKVALVWVQRYIRKFGGDPTLIFQMCHHLGESAGAGSIILHLIGDDGANAIVFHQAMGDSPSLGFLPHYTDSSVEDLFTQFSDLA